MTQAVYNRTSGHLHTVLNAAGLCQYTGKTLEEMQEENKPAQLEVMTFLEALEATQAASRARYCTGPKRISKEHYEEMLNVLPPENWTRGVGYSSFRLSERLSGSIASFFIRIGDSYYQVNEEEDTDMGELFKACASVCRRAGI
jgi:hypothetical protein